MNKVINTEVGALELEDISNENSNKIQMKIEKTVQLF